MSLFYILKYLNIVMNINLNLLSFEWMDGLFEHLLSSYMWIYLIPTVSIISREFLCNNLLNEEACNCRSNTLVYYTSLPFYMLLITLLAVCSCLSLIYYQKDTMDRSEYMAVNDWTFEFKHFAYSFLTSFFDGFPFKRYHIYFYYGKIGLQTLLSFALLLNVVHNVSFRKQSVQKWFCSWMSVIAAFDLAVIASNIYKTERSFFVIYCCFFSVTLVLISRNVVGLIIFYKIKLSKGFTSKNYKLFLSVMLEEFVSSNLQKGNLVLMIGILKRHVAQCTDSSCFCKADFIYNIKKRKNINIASSMYTPFVFKFFLRVVMDRSKTQDNVNVNEWHLDYAEFAFKKFKNIFLANYHLKKAEVLNGSIRRSFRIFRLRNLLNKHIKPERIGEDPDNFIEKVVELEKRFSKIKREMKAVMINTYKFWKDFMRYDQNSISAFKKEMENLVDSKYALDERWKQIESFIDYNPEYNLYYKWFQKDFMNESTQSFSDEEMRFLISRSSDLSMKSSDCVGSLNLDATAFLPDTSIIHVDMGRKSIGKISSTSRGCLLLSGYTENELVGKDISFLMPDQLAVMHRKIMKNYAKTGQLYGSGEIEGFLKTKKGYLTRVNILIKLMSLVEKGRVELVGMLRKVSSTSSGKFDYIVLNKKLVGFEIIIRISLA